MYDYLVVGFGLAGLSFVETALQNDKTVFVISDKRYNSSRVAAGLYNPVVLKRFTSIWHAKEQIDLLYTFYTDIENRISEKIVFPTPLYRKLNSIEEQNNWFVNADKNVLSDFLESNLVTKKFSFIDSPYHFGKVLDTGYVAISSMLDMYVDYLTNNDLIQFSTFDYDKILFKENHIVYEGIKAKRIIFAEGFGLHHNPYFNQFPLDGTKGEVLTIYSEELNIEVVIKGSVFILPLGNHLYRVGATYDWKNKDTIPTNSGKMELEDKLKSIISCRYKIIKHEAEVRPTVRDRRPLVGQHPEYKQLYLLNGLGTRGVMLGPYLSKFLYDFIENDISLDNEVSINRFY